MKNKIGYVSLIVLYALLANCSRSDMYKMQNNHTSTNSNNVNQNSILNPEATEFYFYNNDNRFLQNQWPASGYYHRTFVNEYGRPQRHILSMSRTNNVDDVSLIINKNDRNNNFGYHNYRNNVANRNRNKPKPKFIQQSEIYMKNGKTLYLTEEFIRDYNNYMRVKYNMVWAPNKESYSISDNIFFCVSAPKDSGLYKSTQRLSLFKKILDITYSQDIFPNLDIIKKMYAHLKDFLCFNVLLTHPILYAALEGDIHKNLSHLKNSFGDLIKKHFPHNYDLEICKNIYFELEPGDNAFLRIYCEWFMHKSNNVDYAETFKKVVFWDLKSILSNYYRNNCDNSNNYNGMPSDIEGLISKYFGTQKNIYDKIFELYPKILQNLLLHAIEFKDYRFFENLLFNTYDNINDFVGLYSLANAHDSVEIIELLIKYNYDIEYDRCSKNITLANKACRRGNHVVCRMDIYHEFERIFNNVLYEGGGQNRYGKILEFFFNNFKVTEDVINAALFNYIKSGDINKMGSMFSILSKCVAFDKYLKDNINKKFSEMDGCKLKDATFLTLADCHFDESNVRTEILKFLINVKYIDINLVDSYGNTPLMNAVLFDSLEKVKIYLENPNVDVNFRNIMSRTVLMEAIIRELRNKKEIIEALISTKKVSLVGTDRDIILKRVAIDGSWSELLPILGLLEQEKTNNLFKIKNWRRKWDISYPQD